MHESKNIGIIGGSDGPTAIYISSGSSPYAIVAIAIIAIAIIGFIIWKIRNRKK